VGISGRPDREEPLADRPLLVKGKEHEGLRRLEQKVVAPVARDPDDCNRRPVRLETE
jgi:hypothetical protein